MSLSPTTTWSWANYLTGLNLSKMWRSAYLALNYMFMSIQPMFTASLQSNTCLFVCLFVLNRTEQKHENNEIQGFNWSNNSREQITWRRSKMRQAKWLSQGHAMEHNGNAGPEPKHLTIIQRPSTAKGLLSLVHRHLIYNCPHLAGIQGQWKCFKSL